jgi:hypothetical protein
MKAKEALFYSNLNGIIRSARASKRIASKSSHACTNISPRSHRDRLCGDIVGTPFLPNMTAEAKSFISAPSLGVDTFREGPTPPRVTDSAHRG